MFLNMLLMMTFVRDDYLKDENVRVGGVLS